MENTMTTWKPEAGKRACYLGERNVDVIAVYARTATIRYIGRGKLDDGKIVTARGVSLDFLSAPLSLAQLDAARI